MNQENKYFDTLIDIMERSIRAQADLVKKSDLQNIEQKLNDIINGEIITGKDEESRFNNLLEKINDISSEIKKLKDREDFTKRVFWIANVVQGALLVGVGIIALLKM